VGGVESPIAVHDELIGLGSWGKREGEGPEVSFFSFKRVGGGVPSVKGAGEAD
jgi:predicted phage gp36 major capsid-like protein